jgi:glutathione S-transferase
MYTLYYSPGAASLAVHWLLLDWTCPTASRSSTSTAATQRSEEYLKLNP